MNLSSSPFSLHKSAIRYEMVAGLARPHQRPISYCNLIGGNDQLVFDGNSFAPCALSGGASSLGCNPSCAAGAFALVPCASCVFPGETLELWSALDALVLKALALILAPCWPQLSWRCYHLKGHGGAKAAVREVTAQLPSHQFVFRTDVESYYASIDHELLYQLLERNIHEKPVLRLLWGYLRRTVYDGGIYRDITRSISLGCSLSPFMGALYLQPLDERMERLGVFYARFMDDWLVLALTTVEAARCYSGGQRGHGGVQGQTTPSKDLDRQGYAFFPGHKGQRHHC